ncbi:hypothetical protein FA13DRAFT_1123694 [Coprinellus micaceus]|uniref:F-box domain-containing protein n=1 Tax=Coprinellus micaceus TaxID=71717 RepID=A0A4Y7SWG9_COPMI|nr:hypothetical protein FA13DRAFT_1123694 [Coprinellus micaceus]
MVAVQDALSPSLFTDFLRPIIPTLVDLDLTSIALEGIEIKSLLGAFPWSTQNPPLRRLAIEVVSLERQVFSYASVMLPELTTLELGYCYLDSPTTGIPTPIGPGFGNMVVGTLRMPTIEFCRHLQESPGFDDWGLEKLCLKPLKTWPWSSCKMAIAEAFPRVRTFNGASREEYLASSNMSVILNCTRIYRSAASNLEKP